MKDRAALVVSLPLLVASVIGCGGTPAPPLHAVPKPAATSAPSPAPQVEPAEKKPAERPAKRERPPAEKAKIAQLFQIPQFTKPANPGSYNETRQDSVPQIRLIGFSKVDGQTRALVQIKGEVLAVEQGDVVDGAEVVAVDADGVSFQFGGQRWASRLFEKRNESPVSVARVEAATAERSSNQPPMSTQAN